MTPLFYFLKCINPVRNPTAKEACNEIAKETALAINTCYSCNSESDAEQCADQTYNGCDLERDNLEKQYECYCQGLTCGTSNADAPLVLVFIIDAWLKIF